MQDSTQKYKIDVFIVEDSPLVIERLENLISELPFVKIIGKAQNLESALMGVNLHKPQVAIIDIHLKEDAPDVNGMDLLPILRKINPSIVLIMLTNFSDPKYQEKCLSLGADYFLDKSIDFTRISDILNSLNP